ncbi:MAG: trypsin-like peptidase domain-containing protein [Candidatus Omnitrophica bacterium]|nr:trypsin-like peptidase domain-containing protein [Candidatus Omnitrophota bacterium]
MIKQRMKSGLAACAVCLVVLAGSLRVSDAWALSPEEQLTIAVFEQTSPSVVFIRNAALARDFFSLDIYEIPQGAGSGFVWDADGHIITNFHVVYQASKIEVIFANQQSYAAKIIGASPDHDLAVLKIDAPAGSLKPLVVGNSGDLKVGQKSIAIGNPFGLDYSLTTGVISALGRSIQSLTGRKIHDVIQTDAAINPGNSGGPLLDSEGKLIGVTTAIFSPSGAYAGVGFAIPVDTVSRIVPQLIKFGRIVRVGLGISLLPDTVRKRFGLEGAVILEVSQGGAAAAAKLRGTQQNYLGKILMGDIITGVGNKRVRENDDLISFLEGRRAGERISIEFFRDGKKNTTTVTLQEL